MLHIRTTASAPVPWNRGLWASRVQAEPPTTTDPEYTLNTQPIRLVRYRVVQDQLIQLLNLPRDIVAVVFSILQENTP
jgi:hypothetical protein